MKYIGIITCLEVSRKCTGSGCFKALHARSGAFERYGTDDLQVLSFVHCNGCGTESVENVLERARRMTEKGVDIIHLSTCIQAKCPDYNAFLRALSAEYTCEGYTHTKKRKGSGEDGKS